MPLRRARPLAGFQGPWMTRDESRSQQMLCARQVDGLWQGPTAMSQDFGTVLYRIQLLGFNAIRLPFSFQASHRPPPTHRAKAVTGLPPLSCHT